MRRGSEKRVGNYRKRQIKQGNAADQRAYNLKSNILWLKATMNSSKIW